jgi:hypothetical protein
MSTVYRAYQVITKGQSLPARTDTVLSVADTDHPVWSNSRAYVAGDVATYTSGGTGYFLALQPGTNQTPSFAGETAYWRQIPTPRTAQEVAQDAAIAANPDTRPVLVLNVVPLTQGPLDVDARNTPIPGTGATRIYLSKGLLAYVGGSVVTQHAIATRDQSFLTPAWSPLTSFIGGSQCKFAGLCYTSRIAPNRDNRPDVSPLAWAPAPDGFAVIGAQLGASLADAIPPSWDSTVTYAPGSFVTIPADPAPFFSPTPPLVTTSGWKALNQNTNSLPASGNPDWQSIQFFPVVEFVTKLGLNVTIEIDL